MDGRKGWGRVVRVIVVVVGGVCGVSLQDGLAENGSRHHRWQFPEELIQSGHLAAPAPILEVGFSYDADANPALRVTHVAIKEGYAPQYELLESGYVLSLHSERGDTLSSLVFQIPNQVFNPPPEGDEAADGTPLILRAVDFALTVSLVPDAAELRVTDPQGLLVAQESLRAVPVQRFHPRFRSLPANPPSDGAWFWDWWMPSAEAATTDGTVLDITFVGDNYTSTDLLTYQQDVDRVIGHMMTYEPYLSRSAQLLLHSVDNTTVDLGCVHDATITRLITCDQSTVISVVNDAGAPYDKIIVLVKDSSYGGSGGSTLAVSYNGSSAPQVVTHEFGHTLGSLLDEYNLYSTNGTVDGRTYVNCYAGSPPNPEWDSLVTLSDYAQGCKYPNWYRSSSCSIMKSLSCQYFNTVSQRQLNTKLDYFAGSATTSEESVPVVVDDQPPTVALTSPADGATVSGNVTVSASAADDQGVARVDFYQDSVLLGSDNTAPYSVRWNVKSKSVARGAHTLTATAFDGAGNRSSASVTVFK
jgi:hypothetical protein